MTIIEEYRRAHRLTQKGLADLLGVTQGCVNHIENGKRLPSAKLAVKIESKTKGKITRVSLRPDLFGRLA